MPLQTRSLKKEPWVFPHVLLIAVIVRNMLRRMKSLWNQSMLYCPCFIAQGECIISSAPQKFPLLAPSNHYHPLMVPFKNHGLLFTVLPCTSPVVWQKSWGKISNVFEAPQIYQKLFWFCTIILKKKTKKNFM